MQEYADRPLCRFCTWTEVKNLTQYAVEGKNFTQYVNWGMKVKSMEGWADRRLSVFFFFDSCDVAPLNVEKILCTGDG